MRRRVPEEIMDENGEFVFSHQVKAEIDRLRRALEWYADPNHWDWGTWAMGNDDPGKTARAALGEEQE